MDASRPRNVLIAFCLIVGGGVSILHHGLACGVFFDVSDPIGHEDGEEARQTRGGGRGV